ncbi:MAG: hypothetical protein IH933_02090 [Euryarchaeota archaeon]|jgi:predicted transcriptional regulator|nr:hypothetical protein [Euryarchaeota archaeon]
MTIHNIRLNDADWAILDALEDGRNLAANLEDEIDDERHYISQRLRRLAEHGIVTNLGNGLYELVDEEGENDEKAESLADRMNGFGMFADDDEFVRGVEEARRELNESFEKRQCELF